MALAYPTVDAGTWNTCGLLRNIMLTGTLAEKLRFLSDYLSSAVVMDAFEAGETAETILQWKHAIRDAFQHPDHPRPTGENVLGEMHRQ